jgi:hypothetical protein
LLGSAEANSTPWNKNGSCTKMELGHHRPCCPWNRLGRFDVGLPRSGEKHLREAGKVGFALLQLDGNYACGAHYRPAVCLDRMGLKYIAAEHRVRNSITGSPWRLRDFEFIAASLALVPVLVHEAFEFVSGRCELATMSDSFLHIMSELFVSGFGGELWLRALARLRNWTC